MPKMGLPAKNPRLLGDALQALTGKAATLMTAVLCACVCVGCTADTHAGPVAATVNGEPIYEEAITSYVEDFRAANEGYEDDAVWAAYLDGLGLDGASLRTYVIDYNARIVAVVQDAERLGIPIPTDADIDRRFELARAEYDEMAEYYAGIYGVNSWESYFQQIYVNEANFRLASAADLVRDEHRTAVLANVQIVDAHYLEFLSEYGDYYASKYVSRAVFETQEDAEAAARRLDGGSASWDEVLAECEANKELAAASGNVGWDIFTNSLTYEEYVVLRDLGKGSRSGVFENGKGRYEIIFCVDEFEMPENADTLLVEDIPLEIKDYLTTRFFDNAYDAYLDELYASMELVVHPMPAGLSYDIAGTDSPSSEETAHEQA